MGGGAVTTALTAASEEEGDDGDGDGEREVGSRREGGGARSRLLGIDAGGDDGGDGDNASVGRGRALLPRGGRATSPPSREPGRDEWWWPGSEQDSDERRPADGGRVAPAVAGAREL